MSTLYRLTEPVIIQFLRATNFAALTGKSHTSNDLMSCCNQKEYH